MGQGPENIPNSRPCGAQCTLPPCPTNKQILDGVLQQEQASCFGVFADPSVQLRRKELPRGKERLLLLESLAQLLLSWEQCLCISRLQSLPNPPFISKKAPAKVWSV